MKAIKRTVPVLFVVLGVAAAGCGNVGDAPMAQTGMALDVATAEGQVLPIDAEQSEILWKAAKVTRAHDGGFRSFAGTLTVAGEEVTGIDVTIETNSIWSDADRLTSHLMNEDFFAVDTYPTATFASDHVMPVDSAGATHLVTGNLTMHGHTHAVTFPASVTVDPEGVRANADFIIDRRDWGITYTGRADDLIDNHVRLILDVVATPETVVAGGVPSDETVSMVD
jgi:polyisoprenoid-binding protein YceI